VSYALCAIGIARIMELKTARLTLLIDPNKKAAFERLCARQDRTASQVVRQLIRDYLAQHDAEYVPAGLEEAPAPKRGGRPVPGPATRTAQRRR
jgi:predicted transcriptional regulator